MAFDNPQGLWQGRKGSKRVHYTFYTRLELSRAFSRHNKICKSQNFVMFTRASQLSLSSAR